MAGTLLVLVLAGGLAACASPEGRPAAGAPAADPTVPVAAAAGRLQVEIPTSGLVPLTSARADAEPAPALRLVPRKVVRR